MPFRNSRKKRLTNVNYQTIKIKKRLMDIALKVDHYIYKNKPISVSEAASHYHEVMSYQTLCKHDERSLQVIEKLARQTQAIIAEQTSNNEHIYSKLCSNQDNGSVSPVYSLTEDDKYEFERIQNMESETEKLSFQSEQNTRCDTILIPCGNEIPTSIDIHDMNKQHNEQDYIGHDGQKTIAIVDLTADDNSNNNHDAGSELCSQSILKQLNSETEKLRELNLEECGQGINEVDRAVHDLIIVQQSTTVNNREKKIYSTTVNNRKKKIKSHTIAEKALIYKYNTVEWLESNNNDHKLIKVPQPIDNDREKKTKSLGTAQKPFEYDKVGVLDSQNNVHKLTELPHSQKVVHKPKKSSNTKPKKQGKPRNKRVDNNKNPTQRKGKAANLLPTMVTETIKSDNIHFETDLSWIDNIKFVREIHRDEYVTSLTNLGESLWENCYLPISWEDLNS